MTTTEQKGLMPRWLAGRLIRDAAGFFAGLHLLTTVLSTVLGWLFPALEPSGVHLPSKAAGIVFALLLGSVWLTLRNDRLDLARIAVAANALALLALIVAVAMRGMKTGDSVGMWPGLAIYGGGMVFLTLYVLAFVEIGREIDRRAA